MEKTINIFTIAAILLFTITSCNTECDEPIENRLNNISEYLGYNGFEELKFTNNVNETLTFTGQGNNTFWVVEYGDDTRCTRKYECVRLDFKDNTHGNLLTMQYKYIPSSYKYYYQFFFNEQYFGGKYLSLDRSDTVFIGGFPYNHLSYYSTDIDTSAYLIFNHGNVGIHGVIKFKLSSEKSYTLIR